MSEAEEHPRPGRRRRIWRVVAVAAALVLLAAGIGGYLVYRHLNANIDTISLNHLGPRPSKIVDPEQEHEPLNILLIGSDTRQGEGNHIGGETPGLSDTTILLHVNAERSAAYGVSIPRDSMVQRPPCTRPDGSVDPGGLDLWNQAYAVGGAACTTKQVEQLTGVPVDHVIVVDFHGFKTMVDALGGVQVCVPYPVDDAHSDIHLPAGTYEVDGEQALAYVRERHGFGDGSDVGRMKRQQAFLASMIRKATSMGTLTNPAKLYHFLDAATRSVSTDEGLDSLDDLVGLARQLRGIGLDRIRFTSVPFQPYPPDPNRLQWAPEAEDVWQAMIRDQPLPAPQREHSTTAEHPDSSASPSSSPGQQQAAQDYGLCG